jgi:EAL domain-containing protein (putative c-di-GMP-specific phosphodiesterase class I)
VALDDFGSDLCSLQTLTHRGLSAVKLSRDRVLAVKEPIGREWLHCVTRLAQAQKLCVVAKGVELMRLRPLLAEIGVDALMGDALSPPLTAADFEAWLPKRNP